MWNYSEWMAARLAINSERENGKDELFTEKRKIGRSTLCSAKLNEYFCTFGRRTFTISLLDEVGSFHYFEWIDAHAWGRKSGDEEDMGRVGWLVVHIVTLSKIGTVLPPRLSSRPHSKVDDKLTNWPLIWLISQFTIKSLAHEWWLEAKGFSLKIQFTLLFPSVP